MFEQFKKLRKLKKQMDAVAVEEEYKGITIKMDGSFKVLSLKIENKEDKNLEEHLVEAYNRTAKEIQKRMAKDVMGMGLGNLF